MWGYHKSGHLWLSLSVHICLGLAEEYWPLLGACTSHSYSKLCYLCHLATLLKLSLPPTPPCTLPTHNLIYADPILINSMKNHEKTSHYLLARLVVQKLIDMYSS